MGIKVLYFFVIFLFKFASSADVAIETIMAQGKGFAISGIVELANSVDGIGDFNGDGIDDVIVATWANTKDTTGVAYVVYGSKHPRPEIKLESGLHPSEGFEIRGSKPKDWLGYFASGIGDINGDGLADILVGANGVKNKTGAAYVIFGTKTPLSTMIPEHGLHPSQGFAILGSSQNEEMGASGSRAGDINGDGIDDFMVGTDRSDLIQSKVYVIFGSKQPFSTMIPSKDFKSSQGFKITGAGKDIEQVGSSLRYAGDINSDGIDDIIIGAMTTNQRAGAAYVIYGSREPFQDLVPSLGLTKSQGFAILGQKSFESIGLSVSGAGDVNGDGVDDIIVGGLQTQWRGAAHVIYGNKNGLRTITPNASLDASQGFSMYGDMENAGLGFSVSGIGDINQDGIDDIVIIACSMKGGLGKAYIIYGKKNHNSFVIPATGLDSSHGIVIYGKDFVPGNSFFLFTSANAGDVNGDGIDDIILGSPGSQSAYIIYG